MIRRKVQVHQLRLWAGTTPSMTNDPNYTTVGTMTGDRMAECGKRKSTQHTVHSAARHNTPQPNTTHTTQAQTDRPTDRQAGSQTDKQTDRPTDRQTDRQTVRQTNRQTDRQTDRPTDRQKDKQTDR